MAGRIRESKGTYLVWWIGWALLLFWPLLLPEPAGVAVEIVWGLAVAGVFLLRRRGRTRRGTRE
jgi:hypothetical protein